MYKSGKKFDKLIISPKTRKKLRKTAISGTPKQIAYIALKQQGLNSSQAAKSLNITKGYATLIDKRLPANYSLSNHLIVRGAHRSLKLLSMGKPVGAMTEVKGSDVLGACKEIYSRAEPVIQRIQSTALHINLSDATAKQMLAALNGSSYLPDVPNLDNQGQLTQDTGQGVINV